jgi:hypothetical protein
MSEVLLTMSTLTDCVFTANKCGVSPTLLIQLRGLESSSYRQVHPNGYGCGRWRRQS